MTQLKRSSRTAGAARKRSPKRSSFRRLLGDLLLAIFVLPALIILLYRVLPPPVTPLMLIRLVEGHGGITKTWMPLERISPNLQRAVVASEDAKFCMHNGFDWEAVDKAIEHNQGGGGLRGASTISMQTAKNLFLWPERNFLRKGAEAYLTVWLEALLPKKRILELYLNEIEWGPGIYGAEAAAREYFGVGAAHLTSYQAALMATALPNPLGWRPDRPGPWMRERAGTIQARMNDVVLGKGTPCR